jgi:hypothetical protein
MSWQQFKDNIVRIANQPENIPSTEFVANLYATEYDLAIKRGYDLNYGFGIVSGSIELMKTSFKAALDKGVTTNGPYDLVAEMGAGVKLYWGGVQMKLIPELPKSVATTIPPTALSTTAINFNKVTSVGNWIEPIKPNVAASNPIQIKPKEAPKPANDFKIRRLLDDAGYDAINKYEDNDGCVTLIANRTGNDVADYKKAGCSGYNPGNDSKEVIIKSRIASNIGLDTWAKIPPKFRMQIYSFMYNADSNADNDGGDKLRWVSGLAQALKNENAQYRTSIRTNKVLRDEAIKYIKGLSTSDFEKSYDTYFKVLDEMYQSISTSEYDSRIKKNDVKWANYYKAAYPLTWKARPSTIETYYNESTQKKDSEQPAKEQKSSSTSVTSESVIVLPPISSGPLEPNDNTSLLVDRFIRTATSHLNTVKGTILTTSTYPPVGNPAPGQITWIGYFVDKAKQNQIILAEVNNDYVDDDGSRLKQLQNEGIDFEDEEEQDTEEYGGLDESATKFNGIVTNAQLRALANAGNAVHYIGQYYDYQLGKNLKSVGFNGGLCARWTYNWAKNYVNALRGKGTTNGPAFAAGGHANASRDNKKLAGYWRSLEILGYEIVTNTIYTKAELIKKLAGNKYDIGDVVVYWGIDGPKGLSSYKHGHTQFFTGGYQNYKKAERGTKAPSGKGSYKERWDRASNWDSDAYNNFGTSMVYKGESIGPATKWRYLVFKAPTK